MCSDTPEPDPLIGQAAKANADIAKEALDWYKQKDADAAPLRDQATRIALDQAQAQTDAQRKATALSDEQAARAKTFQPAEDKLLADAMGYDTPERRAQVSGQAMADVGTQADIARAGGIRLASARGIDVNSGNFTAGLQKSAVQEAAAKAAAGNQAALQTEQIGAAKLADAAAIGRGVVSNSAAQTQLALQAGNAAVGNAATPVTLGNQSTQVTGQGFNTAIQGNNSAGNLMQGQYNGQVQADKSSGVLGGIANLAMAGKYVFSDKNMKTKIKPVKGEIALAAARQMPVKSWQYKKGSKGDDGGQQHIGPMAQDAHAAMGERAAPGGTKLDVAASGAVALAAVQEMDKRHQKLEKHVIRLTDAIKHHKPKHHARSTK